MNVKLIINLNSSPFSKKKNKSHLEDKIGLDTSAENCRLEPMHCEIQQLPFQTKLQIINFNEKKLLHSTPAQMSSAVLDKKVS